MTTSTEGRARTTPSLFCAPPPNLELRHNEVHVWCALWEDAACQYTSFIELLSPRERERSKHFVFEHLRSHYIIGQGILRRIIGRYTGLAPDKIEISYGRHGKPYLSHELNRDRLSFNMSQSAGFSLYAFTRGREIGIDVERIREMSEMQEIVSMFFSEAEQAAFACLLPGEEEQGFFRGWTRKEALVKALGGGLSIPFRNFDVSIAPQEPARLLRLPGSLGSVAHWTIADVSPFIGFSASVAFEGDGITLRCWNWNGVC